MNVLRLAAFTDGSSGGNPAGVVLSEALPPPQTMQSMAAEIGYSETAFVAPEHDGWRVRYFAPEVEVDFCGHATIAVGAALAERKGPGRFMLQLNRSRITVQGERSDVAWSASFRSPPTHSRIASETVIADTMALFGLATSDLDASIPPAIIHAGMDHIVIALRDRELLRAMRYDLARGRELARREGLVTFSLIHQETPRMFHARNPFPIGGVYEDPATGAAAAALGGYLRDLDWPHQGSVTIRQGEDIGMPCCLNVLIDGQAGEPITVAGSVRSLSDAGGG